METYKVYIAIPSPKNRWEANVIDRTVTVESFNYMLMNVFLPNEVRNGARIIRIEKKIDTERGFGWEIIKYC